MIRHDFVGAYDYSREEGLLHVADHHYRRGKKQWTWGNGDLPYGLGGKSHR